MKIFANIFNKATDKINQQAENLVSQMIDTGAAKAADAIGNSFSNPISNPAPIPPDQKQQYMQQVLNQAPVQTPMFEPVQQQPNPAQQSISFSEAQNYQQQLQFEQFHQYRQQQQYQQYVQEHIQMYGYPPQQMYPSGGFSQPMVPQVQLTFETPVLKLEPDRVAKMAKYETWFFFKVMKVAKDTIRFVGMKYFSWKIDDDIAIIYQYEQSNDPSLEKAYKKAKYNFQKLEEIKSLQEDKGEDDQIFKDFVYDAIFDNLTKKNELGQLKIPSIWEIGAREIGFFAYEVFSPNKSIEMFFDTIQSDFGKAILKPDETRQAA